MATETYDYVVQGNTWAAVTAACAGASVGAKTALVCPQLRLGGIMANGLGAIDIGRYGGRGLGWLTDEFFRRLTSMAGYRSPLRRASPSAFEMVCIDMLKYYGVYVRTGKQLTSVDKQGSKLLSITTDANTVFAASQFDDGTEDLDLGIMAGVSYRNGRESVAEYGEPLAGFNPVFQTFTPFNCYDDNGNLLPGFKPYPTGLAPGSADGGQQSHTFRLPVTRNPARKRKWPKPVGYDPMLFEYRRRNAPLSSPSWLPFTVASCFEDVGDMNGDFGIPYQLEWSTASYQRRQEIVQLIFREQAGWMWFLANDPSVNKTTREYVNSWGPVVDEFPEAGITAAGWPGETYVRDSNRLRGQYVMRQQDTQTDIVKPDTCAVGFYSLDNHVNQRLALIYNGVAGYLNDSFGSIPGPDAVESRQVVPYQIPLRCMLPNPAECSNLGVLKAVSSTAVAMSSMRIDVWSASQAAAKGLLSGLCATTGTALNDYSVADLQTRLLANGQVLSYAN